MPQLDKHNDSLGMKWRKVAQGVIKTAVFVRFMAPLAQV
jgi:hypothetical protein